MPPKVVYVSLPLSNLIENYSNLNLTETKKITKISTTTTIN